MKMERVGVILFHIRRLAGSDPKQAAARPNGAEYLQLQQGVDMINKKEKPCAALVVREENDSPAPPRKLRKEVSDVSVNTSGAPNCFGTPAQSLLAKREPERSSLPLAKEGGSREPLPAAFFLRRRPGQAMGSENVGSLKTELGLEKKAMNKKISKAMKRKEKGRESRHQRKRRQLAP